MKNLLMVSLLVSASMASAENNPEVFRSIHLSWSPQPGATNYGIQYWCPGADGDHQFFDVGPATQVDLNFLIPGLPYWFRHYWVDSVGVKHFFGSQVDYLTPGKGLIGIRDDGRVRYVTEAGKRSRLLQSDDLTNWVTIADKVWQVDGVAEYFGRTEGSKRFYRTITN